MLQRTLQDGHVEAAAKDDFDAKQYTWFKYTSARGTKLTGARGVEVKLNTGDLYGVKEYTTKEDKILVLNSPKTIIKLAIPKSEKLMDDKSKEFKGKTPVIPTAEAPASKKVKIDLNTKSAKTPKAKPTAQEKKVATLKKKIAEVKTEITRLSKLKANTANARKIALQKAEMKKLKAKLKEAETKVGAAPASTVVSPARVKEASAPVDPVKETKKIGAKKVKITVTPKDGDDDDLDLPPHGSVRYGGGLIEPEELDFDDDTSNLGLDLPIDESWSSEMTDDVRRQKIRHAKRAHLND